MLGVEDLGLRAIGLLMTQGYFWSGPLAEIMTDDDWYEPFCT